MKTIKEFNKSNLDKIGKDVEKALESVATKYGISIKKGSGSYSDNNFTLKIEMATLSESGEVQSKEMSNFKSYAKVLGMSEKDLGKEFKVNGKTFVLSGYLPRSRKYPLLATNKQDGKQYKFPLEDVKNLLGYN